MLSAKPWKPDAMVRLVLGVFICIYAGSLVLTALHYTRPGAKIMPGFFALEAGALGCLGAALVLLRKPWRLENFMRSMAVLLVCFYAGICLGAWAQKLAGPLRDGNEVGQMIIGTLSFQGGSLFLITCFVREHQVGWAEAFGFANQWRRAAVLGVLVACVFLPIGWLLQQASAQAMTHFSPLRLEPEEQQAVHALRLAVTWQDRLTLGVVTILLAPVAEETLFRGILYPAIKQAGFPRLAFWSTAVAFAAVHLNLMTFLPLLVLAVVLTLLYEWTNNLLAPIAAHALFNALNFTLLYVLEKQLG